MSPEYIDDGIEESRGHRCFRIACEAMGFKAAALTENLTALTRAQRDVLHDLWREAMIADAANAGEWPPSATAEASRLQRQRAKRAADGHRAPGRYSKRPSDRILDVLPASQAEALRPSTIAVRLGGHATRDCDRVSKQLRRLWRDGTVQRVRDIRRAKQKAPPEYAYYKVAA